MPFQKLWITLILLSGIIYHIKELKLDIKGRMVKEISNRYYCSGQVSLKTPRAHLSIYIVKKTSINKSVSLKNIWVLFDQFFKM